MTREPATLILLAGGDAKRMGFPKHRLTVGGERILDRLCRRLGPLFVETIVAGRDLGELPNDVRMTEDCYAVRSPLVGIHAGLAASRTDLAFVSACDMPHVEPSLVEFLLEQAAGADVVVPVVRGYYEPLCAVYRRSCIGPIERLIEGGTLKVSALYDRVRRREITEPSIRQHDSDLRSFSNLNTAPRPPALEFNGPLGGAQPRLRGHPEPRLTRADSAPAPPDSVLRQRSYDRANLENGVDSRGGLPISCIRTSSNRGERRRAWPRKPPS